MSKNKPKRESGYAADILSDLDDYLSALVEEPEQKSCEPTKDLGNTCLECQVGFSPAINAVSSGHTGCLKEILASIDKETLISEHSENGATIAHIAARRGDLQSLRMVLCVDNSLCTVGDVRGASPLHVCAHHGFVDCLVCLLDNQGSANQQDYDGATPVHFAAAAGHLNCLRVLLEKGKGDPNAQTRSGETPVYYAAQEGHLDCVHSLVHQYKADPLLASTDGMTPLHAAAQTGRLNITHWLVRSAGCPITSRTVDGATPIHFAAAKGHVAILEWVLHHSLATGLETDDFGGTPVHDAAEYGQLECLHVFYNHSVDLFVKDCEGLTPLDMARDKGHKACVRFLEDPQQAYKEAKRHSQETKNEELGLLFSNDSVGGAGPESTSKRSRLGSWLRTPKRKPSSSGSQSLRRSK